MARSEEERWVEANSILGRYTTSSAAARQRKRRRSIWLTVVAAALLSGTAGGGAGALVAPTGRTTAPNDAATWQYVAGFTLTGIGGIGIVACLVSLIRSGQWGAAWRSPTSVLTRQQRKELLREVRGQQPPDATHLPLARDLARRLVVQRRQVLLMTPLLLMQVGQVIAFPDLEHLVLLGLIVILAVTAIPQFVRDAHRAQRFLDLHDAHLARHLQDGHEREV